MPEGRGAARGELVVFDETGRPIRRHALPAVRDVTLFPNASVVPSPDGRRALLTGSSTIDANGIRGKSWVVDLETGTTSYLSVPQQQWSDERHMIRIDASPRQPSSVVVVDVDTRAVVSRSAIPAFPGSLAITGVTLARGVPPPGAVVL